MLLSELFEDTSTTTTIKIISDILTVQLPELYRRLSRLAENYARDHGGLGKGFNFVAGAPKSDWSKTVFFTGLRPALYNYAKSLSGENRKALESFLSNSVGDMRFPAVEYAVDLLLRIGNETRNTTIIKAATVASNSRSAYESLLDRLDAAGDDEEEISKPPTAPVSNNRGQNASAADALVSSVLSGLNRQVAGEIRAAIARSDNKIQALQQELQRRGIVL